MFLVTSLFYLLASIAYLSYLVRFKDNIVNISRVLLGVAVTVHVVATVVVISSSPEILTQRAGSVLLGTLLISAVFFIAQFKYRIMVAGSFLTPLVTISMYAVHIAKGGTEKHLPMAVVKFITPIHIGSIAAGVLAFGLACVCGVLFILQEFQLKKKVFWGPFTRLPSMDKLDRWGHRLVIIGFPLYTVGLILGAIWIYKQSETFTLGAHYVLALVSWLIYGALLQMRLTVGWKGKRAAMLTVVGFLCSLGSSLYYVLR